MPPSLSARHALPFSQRPPTRLVPMRVLVLGLCRTGTSSLRLAMLHLGFGDVYHMSCVDLAGDEECAAWLEMLRRKERGKDERGEAEWWNRMTGHVEAVLDIPTSLCAEELLRCFPDAKVVLSVRSDPEEEEKEKTRPKHLAGADTFATSVENTILKMRNRTWWMHAGFLSALFVSIVPVPRQVLVRRATFQQLFNILPAAERESATTDRARLVRIYEIHNENVLRLCREQGREVLVYDCKEGWEPLLAFLNSGKGVGRELVVPKDEGGRDMAFPRINDTASFLRVVGAKMREMQAKKALVARKLKGVALGAVVAGLVLWRLLT